QKNGSEGYNGGSSEATPGAWPATEYARHGTQQSNGGKGAQEDLLLMWRIRLQSIFVQRRPQERTLMGTDPANQSRLIQEQLAQRAWVPARSLQKSPKRRDK